MEGLEQPIKVEVVLNDYDYHSAREIVRTVNFFFKNPKAIVSQIKSKLLFDQVESKANMTKLDFGNLLGKVAPGQKEKKVIFLNLEINGAI